MKNSAKKMSRNWKIKLSQTRRNGKYCLLIEKPLFRILGPRDYSSGINLMFAEVSFQVRHGAQVRKEPQKMKGGPRSQNASPGLSAVYTRGVYTLYLPWNILLLLLCTRYLVRPRYGSTRYLVCHKLYHAHHTQYTPRIYCAFRSDISINNIFAWLRARLRDTL